MKLKELELDKFKEFLNTQIDHSKADVDTYLEIEGGRGCMTYLQRKFTEDINTSMRSLNILNNNSINLSGGYMINNIFICGIGWLKILHSPTFDKADNNKQNQNILQGLPESCFKFNLYKINEDKRVFLKEFSTLRRLTLKERFKQWLGKTKPTFTYWD